MPDIKKISRCLPLRIAFLVGILALIFLIDIRIHKSQNQKSQITLEQKTQRVEATLNNFFAAQKRTDTPSGEQIINKSFYKLPPEVEKTRQDSVVVIRFTAARITKDQMSTIEMASSGFVVNDSGAVITALHTLGNAPADWTNQLSSIEVHDGHNFFNAPLVQYDWIRDLAMLQIRDWPNNKNKFQKKPVSFILNAGGNFETINNFYGFCFVGGSEEAAHNLPVIFGPYLSETNIVSGEVNPVAFGVVGGAAGVGCSGSPLIGPDGGVYGVLSRTTDMHTYVVALGELFDFIKSDQLAITKRLIAAQRGK